MKAATYNFELEQGTDHFFGLVINDETGTPVNLTGYSFASQARATFSSPTLAFTLSVIISNQTTNPGQITVSIARGDTTALSIAKNTEYLYDLEMTDASDKRSRILEGTITLLPEVTKS